MNILIVGNGFDLSHYLPTKYDHFMDVMGAIEKKDTGGLPDDLENKKLEDWLKQIDGLFEHRKDHAPPAYQMNFDELFEKTRDPNFIGKTKEFYLTENIEICAKDVLKLQYRLEMNSWYQFFKNHVAEIKTWIDFEQKIEELIISLTDCLNDVNQIHDGSEIYKYFERKSDGLKIKLNDEINLAHFQFITQEIYEVLGGVSFEGIKIKRNQATRNNLNPKFCHGQNLKNGFNPLSFIDFLLNQLEEFIEIFHLYLELLVSQLYPNSLLEIDSEYWAHPDKIFSFNYTNTFQRIHDVVDLEYLHGSHGQYQNIVLGIADIENDVLKKLKAFGFTKYHQKLFKDTDYLFLDHFKEKVQLHKKKIEYFEKDFGNSDRTAKKFERQHLMEVESKLNLKIQVWGHSLDVSDKDYIIDLFSLNDHMDRNVRVTIFYFDKQAKFSLLNNLLAILGKDKVEQWMKNKWLEFKPNPKVKFHVDLNLEEAS